MINGVNLYLNNDKEFEFAYNLCMHNYEHSQLIAMLTNGSIAEKQLAALLFDYVKDESDAQVLLNNLTKCDGKIREAVAYKINHILNTEAAVRNIFAKLSAVDFANATIDINANICRFIIDSAALLKGFTDFSANYSSLIFNYANDALSELDKFVFRDKKYVINKQLFKLYWCLEAMSIFSEYIDSILLTKCLTKCSLISEYTIREKIANIVCKSQNFQELRAVLENDENYYVRQVFISSKHL